MVQRQFPEDSIIPEGIMASHTLTQNPMTRHPLPEKSINPEDHLKLHPVSEDLIIHLEESMTRQGALRFPKDLRTHHRFPEDPVPQLPEELMTHHELQMTRQGPLRLRTHYQFPEKLMTRQEGPMMHPESLQKSRRDAPAPRRTTRARLAQSASTWARKKKTQENRWARSAYARIGPEAKEW